MKLCRKCGETKPLSEFHKRSDARCGVAAHCKACKKVFRDKWYADNPDYDRNRYAAKPEAEKRAEVERVARWAKENKDKHKTAVAAWAGANRPKRQVGYAKRRAAKRKATPAWANEFFIEEAYELAALRTKMFGFRWEVDHIVPLVSDRVCGLHVEHNLRVIPAIENRKKGNFHWPNMP